MLETIILLIVGVEEASLITGITDDMVVGHSIDATAVEAMIADADIIIAHNASFDRPMVEKHWPCFAEKPWGCTLTSIDWLHQGFTAGKLDYLGLQFGWFYDGHRALADCEACLALLAQELPGSRQRVMSAVLPCKMNTSFAPSMPPTIFVASLRRAATVGVPLNCLLARFGGPLQPNRMLKLNG